MTEQADKLKEAVFGGGCFWCTEAIFQRIDGVIEVIPGYSGGDKKDPSYKEVSTGRTGYVEVVKIVFNPDKVSYKKLLEVYWKSHDPTSFDKQGYDVGSQYRSVIFYTDESQKNEAEESKEALSRSGVFEKPVITQIIPVKNFYKAENYHLDFYNKNRSHPYCVTVINPKLKKLNLENSG